MKKKWLITGGCGFLGKKLVKRLLDEGSKDIRIIDNLSLGRREDLKEICNFKELNVSELKRAPKGVELIVGDIIDADLAIKATIGCEIIAHLAANTGVAPSIENPRIDMSVNIIGTFNYLEASRINKVSKFIFASSGATIGEVDPPIHEELAAHPVSPYGASKLAGEGYCSAYKKTFGIETIILRFGNVYGPGSDNKSSVVTKFIRQALDGDILQIYGDGNQTRDFIFIDDLIDAVLLSAKHSNIGGQCFQIATNRETTISEIAEIIKTELRNNGVKNVYLKNVSARKGDVKRNFSNVKKANKVLGWQSKTKLGNGVSKTVSYFIKKDLK